MKTTTFAFTALSLALAIGFVSAAPAANVTFDWAVIGNPGNAGDVQPRGTFGTVDYVYAISKTEVTNAQYTEFLNAVAATDTNSLYSVFMEQTLPGGIERSGSPGSYTYAVKADSIGNNPGGVNSDDYTYANKPVVYVSFLSAMRFTNWLENGQPTGLQDATTTEAGVYTIGNGLNETRNPNATYFIPTEDEWYKAAYYSPNKPEGAGYYDYPTSTDIVADLNNNRPLSDTGNSANYNDISNKPEDVFFFYPLTDVGAYAASGSPYGTFDQGGNVWEWNEAVLSPTTRGIRGGSWSDSPSDLAASGWEDIIPAALDNRVGFRVARSIPEPSSLLLGALASVGLLMRRRCEA